MSNRLSALAVIGILAATAALTPRAVGRQDPRAAVESADVVKWNLEVLNKAPFRLIKATPDPVRRQVRFLVEFVRKPELSEMYDWERGGGPVVFRFRDEDGVVLRSVRPIQEGELVPEKGSRLRFVLPLPPENILAQTRSIVAD
jgi:hypothetical protein